MEGLNRSQPPSGLHTHPVALLAVVPAHQTEQALGGGSMWHYIQQESCQVDNGQLGVNCLPPLPCLERLHERCIVRRQIGSVGLQLHEQALALLLSIPSSLHDAHSLQDA